LEEWIKIGVGIALFAFGKKYFSVGAFLSGNKEDDIVLFCECFDMWDAVGNLTADRIMIFEYCVIGHFSPE